MLPVGPLMKEHRLIERMIGLIAAKKESIGREGKVDPVFIDTAVDFIRTYADKCHHGKEEDILFRELKKKDISAEHTKTMDGLIEDHKYGRELTARLEQANSAYRDGEEGALEKIEKIFSELTQLYEMTEFDSKMIHGKYQCVVEKYEGQG